MPLIAHEELSSFIVSPCCRAHLTSEAECVDCGRRFSSSHGQSVLIDPATSILGATSPPALARGRSRGFRALFDSGNPVAQANIRTMLDALAVSAPVLVVGGGTVGKGVERLYAEADLIAFDVYPSPHTQFVADAHHMPLRDSCVGAVVIQAVLEHVLSPEQVVAEIRRVLTPGGLVYAETAFLQHVHEGAYDFQRFTDSGHRWLFRHFERISSGAVGGPGYQTVWTIDYLVRALLRSRSAGLKARKLALPIRLLDRVVTTPYAIDAASAVFFLGRLADHELAPQEIVDYYQGAQR